MKTFPRGFEPAEILSAGANSLQFHKSSKTAFEFLGRKENCDYTYIEMALDFLIVTVL